MIRPGRGDRRRVHLKNRIGVALVGLAAAAVAVGSQATGLDEADWC